MNKLRSLALLCLWLPCAYTQTVTVNASHLADASGNPLNGTVYFKPAIPFKVTGQVVSTQVSAQVTSGAFSLTLADTSQSSPLNACYLAWAEDMNSNVVLGSKYAGTEATRQGYGCVQVSSAWCTSGVCNFDNFVPTGSPLAIIQTGPAGPPGPVGNVPAQANNTLFCNVSGSTAVPVGCAPSAVAHILPLSSAVQGTADSHVLRDFPSVLDGTGVDATGATDSTTGIQNLLQARLTGHLELPTGIYRVSGLTLLETQRIRGTEGTSAVFDCSHITGTTACVTFASATSVNTNAAGGLQDLTLSCAGNGNANEVALYLGGDPAGVYSPSGYVAANLKFQNVVLHGCGNGIRFGNNAYSIDFVSAMIFGNQIGVYFPQGLSNSGEVFNFVGSAIHDNTVSGMDLNGGSWNLIGTHLDNDPVEITATGSNGGAGTKVLGSSLNLEHQSGRLLSVSPNAGAGYPFEFTCIACTYGDDAATGSEDAMLYSSTYNFAVTIVGGTASTAASGNSANHTVANFLSMPTGGHIPRFVENPVITAGIAAVSSIPTLGLFPSIITVDSVYGNLGNINNLSANGTGAFGTVSTTTGSISTGSHFVSTSSVTPSCGTGSGTSPTCNTAGSDVDGLFSVVTGTSPAASAVISTAVFQHVYASAPNCQITPANAAAAALTGTQAPYAAPTASQLQLKSNTSALAAATTYIWAYFCSL